MIFILLFVIANTLIINIPPSYSIIRPHMTGALSPSARRYNISDTEMYLDDNNIYGCNKMKNISNKLVLVKRGKCSFYKKALNIQTGGGLGMIVGNTFKMYYDYEYMNIYYELDVITRYDYIYMSAPRNKRAKIRIPCVLVHYGTYILLYDLYKIDKVILTLNIKGDLLMSQGILTFEDIKVEAIFFFTGIGLVIFAFTLYGICAWIDRIRDRRHILRRLGQIKEFIWSDEVAQELSIYNSRCSICFENFDGTASASESSQIDVIEEQTEPGLIKVLRCKHAYHGNCIDPWINRHNRCPLCKTPVIDTLDTRFKKFSRFLERVRLHILIYWATLARIFIRIIWGPYHLLNFLIRNISNCFRTTQR